ncbi:MAG TPA: hypothetical protein VJN94_10860 [Candidatus Binataceae bacterium]|nr:hypothetical protein [Candidatus Binataceae bacterium]
MAEVQVWQLILAGSTVLLTLAGLNVGALKWLLDRHDSASQTNARKLAELERQSVEKVAEIQRDILRLRADLPLEYVRREDWIRFGNTLEAKMDTIRAEVREQLAELRRERIQSMRDGSK